MARAIRDVVAFVVALSGCGAPAAPARATTPPPAPTAQASIRHYRKLEAGTALNHASRTTFALSIEGARAELVEVDEVAEGARSLADADRAATWRQVSSRTYRGTVQGAPPVYVLSLDTPGQQPLQMRCTAVEVTAAAAGARRVPAAAPTTGGCDAGRWDPPTPTRVAALSCGEASAADADADPDDDDGLVFGESVPLEYAFENDGCELRGGGLRQVAP